MSHTTKSTTPQAKIQELKSLTDSALRCISPGGSFLRFVLAGHFDNLARDISVLENRAQGLENNLAATRQENTRLTQELEERRAIEDIPFGAVEADHEVARLERENAELQLTLEARVDELEVYKHITTGIIQSGAALTPANMRELHRITLGWVLALERDKQ